MTSNQEPKISPELYKETLRTLKLRSVSLDQVKADCNRGLVDSSEVVVEVNYDAKSEQAQTNYFAFITYSMQSKRADKSFLNIEATYRVTFDTNTPVPQGFFEVFEHLNLRLTTMPYFRELVASITGRMELPTLTLPYEILASRAREQAASTPASIPRKSSSKKPVMTV